MSYQGALETVAKGFKPQGYAKKDPNMLKMVSGMVDGFRKDISELKTDDEMTKYFREGVPKAIMDEFKVDRATTVIVSEMI
jgi:hypothetical protein